MKTDNNRIMTLCWKCAELCSDGYNVKAFPESVATTQKQKVCEICRKVHGASLSLYYISKK